jgi:hypothetical protein
VYLYRAPVVVMPSFLACIVSDRRAKPAPPRTLRLRSNGPTSESCRTTPLQAAYSVAASANDAAVRGPYSGPSWSKGNCDGIAHPRRAPRQFGFGASRRESSGGREGAQQSRAELKCSLVRFGEPVLESAFGGGARSWSAIVNAQCGIDVQHRRSGSAVNGGLRKVEQSAPSW